MPFSLWVSLAVLCVMGAMSPGPSLALVLRHTLSGGRGNGVAAALAHAMGVGFYALSTVWGLGALIVSYPWLFQVITWVGAGYLAWLGIKALRASQGAGLTYGALASERYKAAFEGLTVALGNPKLILFFIALFSQFVTPEMSLAAKVIIVLTAVFIDGGWYVLVALSLSHSRVLPWLQSHAHWIHRITGILLLALALRVIMGPL